ncbi:hypothetical protein OE88DRAFT_1808011 [Heliocybe sulcata]|uniref:Uncharacterized protein n=1 Tax=Heliocybe sulcata TaxID=5364 RepID=A0A5C3N0E8_9AGAM|nr:hypothetical protein OE88DRAFT_1808011 [Heliocybe sulcata]
MDSKSAPVYPITNQPINPAGMDLYASPTANAKGEHDSYCSSHHHSHTHRINKRWLLVPALLALLSLILIACVALAQPDSTFSGLLFGYDGLAEGLVKRAAGDGTGNNNGVFVNRKYYLIIVFVGLFLVVLAAIMLSFWCCRGAFQNPLCCPCYLCACCGGLTCLECIGCGLCADAVENA